MLRGCEAHCSSAVLNSPTKRRLIYSTKGCKKSQEVIIEKEKLEANMTSFFFFFQNQGSKETCIINDLFRQICVIRLHIDKKNT